MPKALQVQVGKTKLKEGLNTDSPSVAEVRKWKVVTRLKALLSGVERLAGDPRVAEALDWRQQLDGAQRLDGPDDDDDQYGLMSSLLTERAEEIEHSEGLPAALAFVGIVHGTATPLKTHLETFLAEQTFSPRYKGDVRRAANRLASWCAKTETPETLEVITRRVAGKFISTGLTAVLSNRKTINKDISALTSYWVWLSRRGHLKDDIPNPWLKQSFEVRRSGGLGEDGEARAFTSDEAAKLLHGPATQRMTDIMWIGALSGMFDVARAGGRSAGWMLLIYVVSWAVFRAIRWVALGFLGAPTAPAAVSSGGSGVESRQPGAQLSSTAPPTA